MLYRNIKQSAKAFFMQFRYPITGL